MIRPTYQSRLNALIVGIRPSIVSVNGIRNVMVADNLSHTGAIAWSTGLHMLIEDLAAEPELTGGEVWLDDWATTEARREAERWTDASTVLELLSVSLGPLSLEAEMPRGPQFWAQWSRNVDAMMLKVEGRSSRVTNDTPELAAHCLELVNLHGGPHVLLDMLEMLAACEPGEPLASPIFRQLGSVVERVQLTALIEASLSGDPVCTANQAALLGQRAAPAPQTNPASCRRRSNGGRARPRQSRFSEHPHRS